MPPPSKSSMDRAAAEFGKAIGLKMVHTPQPGFPLLYVAIQKDSSPDDYKHISTTLERKGLKRTRVVNNPSGNIMEFVVKDPMAYGGTLAGVKMTFHAGRKELIVRFFTEAHST